MIYNERGGDEPPKQTKYTRVSQSTQNKYFAPQINENHNHFIKQSKNIFIACCTHNHRFYLHLLQHPETFL